MRLLVLAALLSAHYANADMTTDLKSGDFKAAYNSSLKEFRSTNREAQTMIDTYERVHKNINFQSNELLCKPDQSDAYHHACLGFTMEREMVSGKFWQDTVGRIAPDVLKIDADVKAHYEKQIQEKAASLAAKIRSEVETKLSECQAGTTIEELEKEKGCIQSIGKKYVGGIFSNSLVFTAPSAPTAVAAPPTHDETMTQALNEQLHAAALSGVSAEFAGAGRVRLQGTVSSPEQHDRAVQIAASQAGVSGVIDLMQVAAPPPAATSRDPAKLEGEINRALRGNGLGGITALVDDDFSVTLKGSANSAGNKSRAFQLVRQFPVQGSPKDRVFVIE